MIAIGRYNTLTVVESSRLGLWLGDADDRVLLPAAVAPEAAVGDTLQVFVYTDGNGEALATTHTPKATVGQFALLEVVDLSPHGAFVDWGLDKDLLIPTFEQYGPLRVGDQVVVYVLLDRDERVMAVSQLARHFDKRTDRLSEGQQVELLVYGHFERGVRCVVDGRYSGVLYHDQTHTPLHLGDVAKAWITEIREDGRLDLSLRAPGRSAADDARSVVIAAIKANEGYLPLTDRSSPSAIKHRLHLSKKQFKRAVGGLYKERKIALEDHGLRWIADKE